MKFRLYYLLQKNSILNVFLICFILSGFMYSVYGTNWYVDRDAPGSTHNGASWNNAWKQIDDIVWSSISDGDSIYVSGGTDSTKYDEVSWSAISPEIMFNQTVVIARSWETGHNGIPYVVNSHNRKNTWYIRGISNIKVTGFTVTIDTPSQGNEDFLFVLERDSMNTIDNCHIIGDGTVSALVGGGYQTAKLTVNNCIIENMPNDYADDQDPIQLYGSRGGDKFLHNIIIERSTSTGVNGGHRDAIQLYTTNDNERLQTEIAYNVIVYDAYNADRVNSAIYTTSSYGMRLLVHDNIFAYNIATHGFGFGMPIEGQPQFNSIRFYNNTVISSSTNGWYPFNVMDMDTIIVKNNIFASVGNTPSEFLLLGNGQNEYDNAHKDIQNNYYSSSNGNYSNFMKVGYAAFQKTFTGWKALGFDTLSYTGAVSFANLSYDTTRTDYYTSQGRDEGVNLSSEIPAVDIAGNPRNDGHWDMGALEFQSGGGGNIPPNQPQNPSPANGSINQPTNSTLSWSCSDPNGDPLTYDVYFGTSNNPPLVSGSQSGTSYNPGQLNNSTTYYWKIVAKDNYGASTTGPVWNFSTIAGIVNNPPNQPSDPNPVNGAIDQDTILTISWTCTDPDGDPLLYDVYFGTSNIPPLVSSNQSAVYYNPGQLNSSTTYYWKIIAKDNQGATTAGPVWNFTTTNNIVVTDQATVELKVLLEGPYTDSTMVTDLGDNSLIPLTQPYNTQPWNYNGNEQVNNIPSNTVDWILLELRSASSPSTIVGRRAVFIKKDGLVDEIDGSQRITFQGVTSGEYYVAVFHRNHLAIMTRIPIFLSDTTSLYDFTISENMAYGNEAMKDLGNGKFGLYAADGNGNGNVNNSDNNSVWRKQNGTLGYEDGDFDLNGGVNIVDKNGKWKPNNGKSSYVP